MKILFTAILFPICSVSLSQAEHIIEIDPATGTFTKICAPIPNVGWVSPEDGVYDENNSIFYFVSASPCACLQAINTVSGTVVSSPTISGMMTFQFDNSAGVLYGLKQDNANNQKMFGLVNPLTAVFTQIGPARTGSSLYQGSFNAFDENLQRFIFLETGDVLVSIEVSTGSVVASPQLQLSSGDGILGLVFNNQDGKLYGTLNNTIQQASWLVTIDPQTGAYTKIGPGTGLSGSGGSAAIDESGGTYILLYAGNSGFAISTIDLSTGLVNSTASLNPLPSPENAFNIVFDRIRNKVFALHWSTSYELVGLNENNHSPVSVFPVPAQNEVRIDLPVSASQVVKLFDGLGKLVYYRDLSGQDHVIIDRGSLSAGVYHLQVESDKTLITRNKVVFMTD